MRHCWDPVPTNRPTAVELWDYFYELWEVLNNKYSIIKISENHKEKFTRTKKQVESNFGRIGYESDTFEKNHKICLPVKGFLPLKIGT
ncbi:unnamed protein product [Rhizophagus irregularis]|nr:unnamed protein product [Rhizophagus irregularis]